MTTILIGNKKIDTFITPDRAKHWVDTPKFSPPYGDYDWTDCERKEVNRLFFCAPGWWCKEYVVEAISQGQEATHA